MPLNLIFIQPGNYTIDDNGVPGDNISVIRDGNGVVIFTFGHPADALGFTVSTTGVNITVNFTDSMNAANFTIANLTDLTQSPDSILMRNIVTTGTVTLVANNTITEAGADFASDITAGAVILSAVNGIGTPGNALETRTGLFEAETTTGGVTISNIGSVQIGGVSPDVDGLDVATSGDIYFNNVGSIFLTEGNTVTAGEVIHGGGTSGNITLIANGFNSDIIGNVDNGAATASRGSLAFTAGRDIQLGTVGSDFNNDIITNGSLNLTAGRDIVVDGFADLLSDNFGLDTGGSLFFNAGRNISILNVAGVSASVTASGSGGGNAVITTGVGGALTVNGPGSFGLGSTSGSVIVNADRVLIDGGSGISSPTGSITLRPATSGRDMILGSATDAALAVELSDLELNRIFSPTLTIGGTATGPVRVTAPVAPISAGNASNITIISATNITIGANVTTLGALTLRAGDDVSKLSSAVANVGGAFTVFVDQAGDDLNGGGTAFLAGTNTATSVTLNGNAENDLMTGSGAVETLYGFAGNDVLLGLGGNDTLVGGPGNDTMEGGLGDDHYYVDSAGDVVVEGVGEGTLDRIFVSTTYAQAAGVFVETLTTDNEAGTFAINLTGNELANLIKGNAGINALDGRAGADTLTGLGGADLFRFTTALGAGNIDAITDYNVADDVIQLEDAVFTALAPGALAAGAFNTGAAATDADDRIIYNSATGALLYDADGAGGAAAVQFATLSTGLAMTASEFFVF